MKKTYPRFLVCFAAVSTLGGGLAFADPCDLGGFYSVSPQCRSRCGSIATVKDLVACERDTTSQNRNRGPHFLSFARFMLNPQNSEDQKCDLVCRRNRRGPYAHGATPGAESLPATEVQTATLTDVGTAEAPAQAQAGCALQREIIAAAHACRGTFVARAQNFDSLVGACSPYRRLSTADLAGLRSNPSQLSAAGLSGCGVEVCQQVPPVYSNAPAFPARLKCTNR